MNPTQTTPSQGPATGEVLRAAADHIERHGFNQGSFYDNPNTEHPAACAVGAIAIAAFGEPLAHPNAATGPGAIEHMTAFYWLQDYLRANLGDHQQDQRIGVYSWNDTPHTTGQDVIDTLRAAAHAWDADNSGGGRS